MKYTSFYSWIIILAWIAMRTASAQQLSSANGMIPKLPYSHMALSAKLIGPSIVNSDWFHWGVSPIIGKDGKVYLFVERWPAEEGMGGWMGMRAEIAMYEGDKPDGPFNYVRTVLKTSDFPNPEKMWAPHNPRIEYVDGKYILLYIFQTIKGSLKMHTGMMIAENLKGPWHFAGNQNGLLVENSKDPNHWTYNGEIGADNPAFMKIDKKYYIYFKSGMPAQMSAKYGYAVADKLEGPYTLSENPITDNISYIEDAMAFKANDTYYLITTDNLGGNTGVYGNLILWESETGLDFKLADAKIAMGNLLDYWGTDKDHGKLLSIPGHFEHDRSGKMERPAVLFIDGVPAFFYAAGDLNLSGGKVAENYVFKIYWNRGQ